MNPSSFNPHDPFGNDNAEQIRQRFDMAVQDLWKVAFDHLVTMMPQTWKGFQCVVDVEWNPATGQFHFRSRFGDTASNRTKGIRSHHFLSLIGALHVAYRQFQQDLEWKQVVFVRTWDKAVKKWEHKLTRTDGRTVKKPDQSDPENVGLS
jgi:hypothetical protein